LRHSKLPIKAVYDVGMNAIIPTLIDALPVELRSSGCIGFRPGHARGRMMRALTTP
jgi:hypothetical protein